MQILRGAEHFGGTFFRRRIFFSSPEGLTIVTNGPCGRRRNCIQVLLELSAVEVPEKTKHHMGSVTPRIHGLWSFQRGTILNFRSDRSPPRYLARDHRMGAGNSLEKSFIALNYCLEIFRRLVQNRLKVFIFSEGEPTAAARKIQHLLSRRCHFKELKNLHVNPFSCMASEVTE
jgi:hypothetical protein